MISEDDGIFEIKHDQQTVSGQIEQVVSENSLTGEYHADVTLLMDKLKWISGYLCENTRFSEFKDVVEWGKSVDKILDGESR